MSPAESGGRPRMDILLVEDNPGDVRLIEEALREGSSRRRLAVVRDGEEALAYLRRQDPFPHATPPRLILLDLNLHRKDGRDALAEIKADPRLKRIPVVVLTTSTAEEDVLRSYEGHANCYVAKPLDLERFTAVILAIESFWLSTVQLPPEAP